MKHFYPRQYRQNTSKNVFSHLYKVTDRTVQSEEELHFVNIIYTENPSKTIPPQHQFHEYSNKYIICALPSFLLNTFLIPYPPQFLPVLDINPSFYITHHINFDLFEL